LRYRLTCLTPLLVGDGRRLSPIDYMVWKDQVNVLDQQRIFQLLAKGPRLENYLAQLKRAEKLEFASWGGFAQNFAGRRIPFEHPSCAVHWERAVGESVHIPTFISGPAGPYLPGTAIKGALRTGMLYAGMKEGSLEPVAAQFAGERPPRRPAEVAEDNILGALGASRLRLVSASDSAPVPSSCLKVYLLRVATLQAKGHDSFELGWKLSPRGTVNARRPEESTPTFAEMASPGTVFEGRFRSNPFLSDPQVRRSLRWREPLTTADIFAGANAYAARLLALHREYAHRAGLSLLDQHLRQLEERLGLIADRRDACLLSLGWGGGLLAKVAWLRTDDPTYREIIRQSPLYGRRIAPGLPFPKTRRVVFLENRPATLPGWALLETFSG